ncbi:hypothetical protein ACWFMI_21690 [Nocardiopsis terrae]
MSRQRAPRADPRGRGSRWVGAACLLLVPPGSFGAYRELTSSFVDVPEAAFAALTALLGAVLGLALLLPPAWLKWWPLGVGPLALGFLGTGLMLLWDPAAAVNTEFANSRRNSTGSVVLTGVFLLLLGAGGLAALVAPLLPRTRRRSAEPRQLPARAPAPGMTPKQRRRARKHRNRAAGRR